MALLLKNGAIFLHVPKTGGNWVEQVLRKLDLVRQPVGRQHIPADRLFWYDRHYHDGKVLRNLLRRSTGLLPRLPADAFKFCFLREPLDWYVSWWRYMQGPKNWRRWGDEINPYHWSPIAMLNDLGSPDFNMFMQNVNRKRPGFVTEMFGWYVPPGIAFVGRQENLADDLARVLQQLEVSVSADELCKMPRMNESSTKVPKPEWDPAVKRETLRLEYAGYVRHGYAPPASPD